MKKIVIAALMFCIIGGSQVAHAEEVTSAEDVTTLSLITPFDFKNYPPSTYAGKTLVKVEKIKNGYRGWYI
ncbi:hypothetical protein DOK78_000518 [Enterococcus sp. DIV2402]|jgi:hypothetical protein|uniref:Uncharacterized protein n=1 Tax=Candidatus Enterococcus lowellii TaxID=2230877 RepID=A0ABZ2SJ92_9ENTE|nr:hypothetical protein [Enterococcus sp. DIV2402]MBO0465263.1 hypothetical protein [Enterococcus sp. DIV2402]